jgi:hypothetical protein
MSTFQTAVYKLVRTESAVWLFKKNALLKLTHTTEERVVFIVLKHTPKNSVNSWNAATENCPHTLWVKS